jgi:O-acetyl-ADP-ribose deacetylase (regulator of RNase III)
MSATSLKVTLVDINPQVVKAWQTAFEGNPEVAIVRGSLLDQKVDAWVTPTNARGSMDGGVDALVKRHFRPTIQVRVQSAIKQEFGALLPVGTATCVTTGHVQPRWLISTPTMLASAEDVSETLNVALACAAAFQAIHQHNARSGDPITSVALPGLGANTGRVPPRVCANLMWTGYMLFQDYRFRDWDSLRAMLLAQLGGGINEDTQIRVQVS